MKEKRKPFIYGEGAKKCVFTPDIEPYLTPDDEKPVKDLILCIKGMRAAVVYTEVKRDTGTRIIDPSGIPNLEEYDNGLVGYQHIDYFKTSAEAEKQLWLKKRVSNKFYVDMFMVKLY